MQKVDLDVRIQALNDLGYLNKLLNFPQPYQIIKIQFFDFAYLVILRYYQ